MPQFVLFETGKVQFGLVRSCINRVEPMCDTVRAAMAPDVRQRIGPPGGAIDLIDLSKALEGSVESSPGRDAEVILLNGNAGLSLLADKVGETLEAGAEQLYDLPPVFSGNARACFPKVLRIEDTMALIIAVEGLETIRPIMHHANPETCAGRESDGKEAHPGGPQQDAPAVPLDGNRLEGVMIRKLSHMIGQQVDQVVERTIAAVLERNQANTK